MRLALLLLVACAAPGVHGGLQLAMDTDRRVVAQLAAGADGGFTSGDLASKNALIFLAGEGRVGVDVANGDVVGTFRLGMMGWNFQPPHGAYGHRTMFGFIGRFSRASSTMGFGAEYWRERVLASSFDPGLCPDEGEYRFHALEGGVAVDYGFAKTKHVWTWTVGGHYRWTAWAHVHPFTDCARPPPASNARTTPTGSSPSAR